MELFVVSICKRKKRRREESTNKVSTHQEINVESKL